ncbi:HAD-IIB family hydrolase [Paenibacillus sp. GD4]|uniref:HAD family hydrolase n=1 Tax=Paenibacillus sp. GD4 TaxID=3068890 RepID=UPI0027965A80|nr:HAD-IIB family hydrolase [Paenibacillus sp. GD4]MDQ1911554.1 HAD-IIB family hydrolase [Paenibacillus sp. GD4]
MALSCFTTHRGWRRIIRRAPELILDIRHHASGSAPDAYVCFEIDDELYSDRRLDHSDVTVLGIPPGLPLPEPLTQARCRGARVSKSLSPGREGLYDSLQANFGDRLQIVQTDRGRLLQVMAAGVSKASALQKAAERLHIPIERIMAFGDDFNDLSLFEPGGAAGLSRWATPLPSFMIAHDL